MHFGFSFLGSELAWFSERAQAFQETKATIDVVREFLQMCDCDLEPLVSYIDVFSVDRDAMRQVILALDNIFMRFQDQDEETTAAFNLRTKVAIQAQKLLSTRGAQLTSLLADDVCSPECSLKILNYIL